MFPVARASEESEQQFALLVDSIVADPLRHDQLCELLQESNPCYDGRGTTATARMRGWVILGLGHAGVTDATLPYVLEELDTGIDPYLVAASARALRSYANRSEVFAGTVMRALSNIRYRDEPVSFASYGEYDGSSRTSPVQELLETLSWLGPSACCALQELETLRMESTKGSAKRIEQIDRALKNIRAYPDPSVADACCTSVDVFRRGSWKPARMRKERGSLDDTLFEDHDGRLVTFREFFIGYPSVVVFFYTRCDNPLKCSLTVTKLGRLQAMLAERGIAHRVQTAAISYDPGFDQSDRLRAYGQNRGVRLDDRNRMLRTEQIAEVRRYFELGVNFIGSLVNRHRVEAFVLDCHGRTAATFARFNWDEATVTDRVETLLNEDDADKARRPIVDANASRHRRFTSAGLTGVASIIVAFFPKCGMCWAAYLSVFGVAGMSQIPYSPWLLPLFGTVLAVNIATVAIRARMTGRWLSFGLTCAGAAGIVASVASPGRGALAAIAIALTSAGSLLNVVAANAKSGSPWENMQHSLRRYSGPRPC